MFTNKIITFVRNCNIEYEDRKSRYLSFKCSMIGITVEELDKNGICASAGSACSTGSSKPSHVLTNIGLEKERPMCKSHRSCILFVIENIIGCTCRFLTSSLFCW